MSQDEIKAWVSRQLAEANLTVHTLHVNMWTTRAVSINVFVPTDADLAALKQSGLHDQLTERITTGLHQQLADEEVDMRLYVVFDSYQYVKEHCQGNWYYYYK